MRRALVLLPGVILLSILGVFLLRLGDDPAKLPSTLIGKPAPALVLPALEGSGTPAFSSEMFIGQVTLVNFFASWCVPCHQEHAQLLRLAQDRRLRLVGVNYKDAPENARKFLEKLGNPFLAISVDAMGRAGIDWGVYGVPESFLVGRDGRVAYKWTGPLLEESLNVILMPEIEKLLAQAPQ